MTAPSDRDSSFPVSRGPTPAMPAKSSPIPEERKGPGLYPSGTGFCADASPDGRSFPRSGVAAPADPGSTTAVAGERQAPAVTHGTDGDNLRYIWRYHPEQHCASRHLAVDLGRQTSQERPFMRRIADYRAAIWARVGLCQQEVCSARSLPSPDLDRNQGASDRTIGHLPALLASPSTNRRRGLSSHPS